MFSQRWQVLVSPLDRGHWVSTTWLAYCPRCCWCVHLLSSGASCCECRFELSRPPPRKSVCQLHEELLHVYTPCPPIEVATSHHLPLVVADLLLPCCSFFAVFTPSRSSIIWSSCFWKISPIDEIPNGMRFHLYLPKGIAKVVSKDASLPRGTCQ